MLESEAGLGFNGTKKRSVAVKETSVLVKSPGKSRQQKQVKAEVQQGCVCWAERRKQPLPLEMLTETLQEELGWMPG